MPVRESATMPLKLGAFAAMQPEPGRAATPATSRLAADRRRRAVAFRRRWQKNRFPMHRLQKADVAPEHEAVVRRIFTRE